MYVPELLDRTRDATLCSGMGLAYISNKHCGASIKEYSVIASITKVDMHEPLLHSFCSIDGHRVNLIDNEEKLS